MTRPLPPHKLLRPNRLPARSHHTSVSLLEKHVRWIGNTNRSMCIRRLIDAEMEKGSPKV